MPISIRLDPKSVRAIERLARKRGQTKSDVVRDAIAKLKQEDAQGTERPSEMLAHLIGVAASGGTRLSERTGDRFAAIVRQKARERRPR